METIEERNQRLIEENKIYVGMLDEIIKTFKIGDKALVLCGGEIIFTCVRITKKMVFLQQQKVSTGNILPEELRITHRNWASWLVKCRV